MRRTPASILLIRLHHMGDVLLTTPAIRRLRRSFPEARICYLTRGAGLDVVAGNPHLDEVLPYRGGVRGEVALCTEIRRRRFDAVVDFHCTPRSARLVWASRSRWRIGVPGRGPRNRLYTQLLPAGRDPHLYAAARFLQMLQPLGVTSGTDLSLELAPGEPERRWAAEGWERLGLARGGPVVALSAVARDPCKQWGLERWAAAADALVDSGARVLLTHGPGEDEQVERVVAQMRRPAVRELRPASMRQLAALYERSDLWIGNDGGPKHVAVAAGTPTVAVVRAGRAASWTDPTPAGRHRFAEGEAGAADCRGGIDAIPISRVVDLARDAVNAGHRAAAGTGA